MRINTNAVATMSEPTIKVHLYALENGINQPVASEETPQDPVDAIKFAAELNRDIFMHVASSGNYDRDLVFPAIEEVGANVRNSNGDDSILSVGTVEGANILVVFKDQVVFEPGTTVSNPVMFVDTPNSEADDSFGYFPGGDNLEETNANGGNDNINVDTSSVQVDAVAQVDTPNSMGTVSEAETPNSTASSVEDLTGMGYSQLW